MFIGRAQEKTGLFRTEKRRDADGAAYPWIVRSTGVVNQFYVYAVDADFGPFFLKFCSYFPYNAKLCINGHEWAKRQAAKAGIGFTALDNGFATCADPAAVQAICDRLGPAQIEALLRKWLAILPHPFTAGGPGRRLPLRHLDPAGRVLPDPGAGPADLRAGVLRAGHPRQPRRRPPRPGQPDLRPAAQAHRPAGHPGPVPHPGDHRGGHPEPAHRLQAHQDQAVPQGRTGAAHRDHDQRHPRLRDRETADQSARAAGDRLLRQPAPAGRPTTQPQPDPRRRGVHRRARADHHRHGQRIAGLRLGDRRAHALLQALLVFRLLSRPGSPTATCAACSPGCSARTPTRSPPARPATTCAGCAPTGSSAASPAPTATESPTPALHHAMLLTHIHTRLLQPGLAQLTDPDPPTPTTLRAAANAYRHALDQLTQEAGLAA